MLRAGMGRQMGSVPSGGSAAVADAGRGGAVSGAAAAGPALPPEALAGVSVFRGLGPASLRRLALGARALQLVDGAQVFTQGDAADCVFTVLPGETGQVCVGALEAKGKRLLVEVFGPGEVFGEL